MSNISGTPEIMFPHLGIVIEKLDRVAVTIFGMPIYWYGVILGLGVFAGFFAALRECKRTGIKPEDFYDFVIYAVIFSIIGARLYYVIFSWDTYKGDLLSIFNLRKGGIAIYGAVIAATITTYLFTKKRKIKFLKFADACVFGLILGQIIGRWGNFVNREAFGGYTDSLFAMQYLKSQVSGGIITKNILDNIMVINGAQYIQVHPTFLYEMFWNIGVLIFMQLYKKRKKFDGEIFLIYFVGYGFGRFCIEGLRTDQLMLFGTGFAVSQLLSALLVVVSLGLIIFARAKVKNAPIGQPDDDLEMTEELDVSMQEDKIDNDQESENGTALDDEIKIDAESELNDEEIK